MNRNPFLRLFLLALQKEQKKKKERKIRRRMRTLNIGELAIFKSSVILEQGEGGGDSQSFSVFLH